uniref:Putative ixodes 8-cys protein n=1 Tax=Ixodes ricinus TaxID=34613 RepID=A0A0K8R8W1_IXORI
MFKLKFFILFVLAGLCFGDASASETAGDSSGTGASSAGDSSGTGASSGNQNGKQETETSNGQTSNGENSDDQNPASTNNEDQASEDKNNEGDTVEKTFENAVGLPSWITEKKPFLNTLLSLCHNQNPRERISNDTINWEKCEYRCRHERNEHGHVKQLPENTPCGTGKICKNSTCVEEPVTLPSCR